MRGFDLDGTLTYIGNKKLYYFLLQLLPDLYLPIHERLVKPNTKVISMMRPEDVIITGRRQSAMEYTKKWLEKHGVHNKIYMNPYAPGTENNIRHKTEVITELGIQEFYDDEPIILEKLHIGLKIVTYRVEGKEVYRSSYHA